MPFDKQFICSAVSGISMIQGECPPEPAISIDSRTIRPGDIFVALSGAHHDGHTYLKNVLEKKAGGIIIAQHKKDLLIGLKNDIQNHFVLVVDDPLQALYDLASAWRKQFTYPVVAITGSVGKTSTKELLAHILRFNGARVLATHENQNTRIGLAINMLRMRSEHQAAIFELGISKRGEMAKLAELLRHTYGVITCIGHSHMEGLGSLTDIALEKRAIFNFFTEQSIGIINGDQPILATVSYLHPVVKFGQKTTNQIQARKVRISGSHINFTLKIYQKKYSVSIKSAHAGVVQNALAAASVATLLGVEDQVIVRAIQEPPVVKQRFEVKKMTKALGTMIDDCYNASPESMKAALLAFQQFESRSPKIAVLGDMLGLGVNSPFWHRQLGRFLRKVPSLQRVILVGTLVEWTEKTAPLQVSVERVPSWQDAISHLQKELQTEAVILVKGSNAMGLSNLVDHFTKIEK